MVGATTKRTRKYGKKEKDVVSKKPLEAFKKYRVLIDSSNIYPRVFKSYEEAATWVAEQDKKNRGRCVYSIMES